MGGSNLTTALGSVDDAVALLSSEESSLSARRSRPRSVCCAHKPKSKRYASSLLTYDVKNSDFGCSASGVGFQKISIEFGNPTFFFFLMSKTDVNGMTLIF